MLGQNKKKKMKAGLIQNNYIQLFPLLNFFFFTNNILLQLKVVSDLKQLLLTEDRCD